MNTQNQNFRAKLEKYKEEYQRKKAEGYDVSEVKRLALGAKEARRKGDKPRARQLAKEAIDALKNAKKIV